METTPISATGEAELNARAAGDGYRGRGGFTLVELMMTMTIIGLAASAVVLSIPDPRQPIGAEAERFAARLVRAREEAILTNRPVAVTADAAGYAFSSFDGATWTPLAGAFETQAWGEGVAAPREPIRLTFDPTGVSEPGAVRLSRDGQTRTITVDGAGEVAIDD